MFFPVCTVSCPQLSLCLSGSRIMIRFVWVSGSFPPSIITLLVIVMPLLVVGRRCLLGCRCRGGCVG